MPGPLAGLRVLELARILAGPWAGQLLADLGADVIKVERTGTGDDTRAWGPPFVAGADGGHLDAAYFHCTNRGKRSIEADFTHPDGQRIVQEGVLLGQARYPKTRVNSQRSRPLGLKPEFHVQNT